MASSDRFVAVGEEEMERLLSDKDFKNTKWKISSSLNYFRTFLAKNYQNDNFESYMYSITWRLLQSRRYSITRCLMQKCSI